MKKLQLIMLLAMSLGFSAACVEGDDEELSLSQQELQACLEDSSGSCLDGPTLIRPPQEPPPVVETTMYRCDGNSNITLEVSDYSPNWVVNDGKTRTYGSGEFPTISAGYGRDACKWIRV